MNYSKDELVQYRLNRAKEAFEDGQILASKERWNAASNRMYYACFYIISAYLAKEEMLTTTHSGLKTIFNKEWVKTNKVKKEDGKIFNMLFGLRHDADYEDFYALDKEDIYPLIRKVKLLIEEIEKIINE